MESQPVSAGSQMETKDDYLRPEVDELGMQALHAYQRQHEIADRQWAYFNQYTGMLYLLAFAMVVFRKSEAVAGVPTFFMVIPMLAYYVFFAGNHRSLMLTVAELTILRNVAMSKTRLELRNSPSSAIRLFHMFMALSAITVYATAWMFVRGTFGIL